MLQLKVPLILPNKTKEEWETLNPTLYQGEVAFERDTNKIKIGNGIQQWSDLPYTS